MSRRAAIDGKELRPLYTTTLTGVGLPASSATSATFFEIDIPLPNIRTAGGFNNVGWSVKCRNSKHQGQFGFQVANFSVTIFKAPCSGDIDLNGSVDAADLTSILAAWFSSGKGLPEDLNGDGSVDRNRSWHVPGGAVHQTTRAGHHACRALALRATLFPDNSESVPGTCQEVPGINRHVPGILTRPPRDARARRRRTQRSDARVILTLTGTGPTRSGAPRGPARRRCRRRSDRLPTASPYPTR